MINERLTPALQGKAREGKLIAASNGLFSSWFIGIMHVTLRAVERRCHLPVTALFSHSRF
jgi:hypothetical protein